MIIEYNSVLSSRASVGKDCYLEVSYVHGNSRIGSHSVLSYIDVQDQTIPDNVVLHGLKQRNGKFIVRIFGVNDNPKENRLFGRDLDELEDTLGVRFWEENGQAHTLWSAGLYQEADTIREATDAALELYEIVTGGKDFDRSLWTAASHKSLCAGFNEADPDAIIAWNKRMADLVTMDGIAKAIRDQVPAGSIRKLQSLTKIQKEWLRKRLRKADFGEKMRLHYYLGVILEDENEVQECFRIIQSEVLEERRHTIMMEKNAKIYVAGHRGMVGSAIVRELQRQGYTNIVTRTHKELDLTRQDAVEKFFAAEKPEYVFLAAAKVGGIVANQNALADFMYDNMILEIIVPKNSSSQVLWLHWNSNQ